MQVAHQLAVAKRLNPEAPANSKIAIVLFTVCAPAQSNVAEHATPSQTADCRPRRFPILAKRYDGKRFCLPLSSVKHALGYDVTSADFSSSSGDDGEGAWEAKVS